MERRLAAVFIADVVGYGRLSELDEEGTRARFQADLSELFAPKIAEHHGRVVKTMGDGLLVEFASPTNALRCAVEIQAGKVAQNAGVAADRRLVFRIGINLGDVIVEGDDIHGDGVNIADRIQALAEPGGIAVSGTAYDQLKSKLAVGYADLGGQHVKSIAEPVRVYRVLLDPKDAGRTIAAAVPLPAKRSKRWPAIAAVAIVLVAAVGVAAAWLRPWEPRLQPVATGKPSIAVLPFGNLGGDADQAYFAEGLTDDLITDLSKIAGLLVIARNSTVIYRDQSVDAREVARQLGVRYVLQGSVRRSGDAVRINAQLIDGTTGTNVWAERYDRPYAGLFALQDEVIERITGALSVRLTESEKTQVARLPTHNLEAYDIYTRAEQKVYELTEESLGEAAFLYKKAIALDPQFADAYAGYARALVDIVSFPYQHLLIGTVARQLAYEAAGRALELNAQTPRAYAVLGLLQSVDGAHDQAIESVQKAIALEPNSADAQLNLAIVLIYAGRQAEALAAMERVLQLNPKAQSQVYDYYGLALFMNKRYEDAVKAIQMAGTSVESDLGFEVLAMAYARLGRTQDAHAAIEATLTRSPGTNLTELRASYGYHRRREDLDDRIDALRDAGLPEWPYDFHGSPADRLDGAAIRALAVDKIWIGHQHGGTPFVMQISAKGDYAQRGPQGITAGTITFEGDLMCMQSGALFVGREFCVPVYRHPGGTHETQDEYVFPDVATVWFFSVSP